VVNGMCRITKVNRRRVRTLLGSWLTVRRPVIHLGVEPLRSAQTDRPTVVRHNVCRWQLGHYTGNHAIQ